MLLIQDKTNDYRIIINSDFDNQMYITAATCSKVVDPVKVYGKMYSSVLDLLKKSQAFIFHERVFGSLKYYNSILETRKRISSEISYPVSTAFSYIEGNPVWSEGISGFHICAFTNENNCVKDLSYNGQVVGRICDADDAAYYLLSGIHSKENYHSTSYNQTAYMFNKVNTILNQNQLNFKNVMRTWIYLHDILSQYDDFNLARNKVFNEFGLLKNGNIDIQPEEVYLPASTGIGGSNIHDAYGCMDILAVKIKNNQLKIIHDTGQKQKAAFRYGSAFSRSVLIENKNYKKLYLSGTASIDEKGRTVHIGNIEKQIEKTGEVIEALLANHSMTMNNLLEGTVFLKKAEYIDVYKKYVTYKGWDNLPFIIIIADVCRTNLLFEIDASFGLKVNDKK